MFEPALMSGPGKGVFMSTMSKAITMAQHAFGKDFESRFADTLTEYARKNHSSLQFWTDTETDRYEGTDFTLDGIRNDVTVDFISKDNTELLDSKWLAWAGVRVNYGVRRGNRWTEFTVPVLVIGFDFVDSRPRAIDFFFEQLESHIDEIINDGADLYLDAVYPE